MSTRWRHDPPPPDALVEIRTPSGTERARARWGQEWVRRPHWETPDGGCWSPDDITGWRPLPGSKGEAT